LQALIRQTDRVCLECLTGDMLEGRLPYGRLLWRLEAVTCCPIHRFSLVEARCGKPTSGRERQFGRRKLGGSCGTCGSLGYRCLQSYREEASTYDVWRATQCMDMLAELPNIASSNPLVMKDAMRVYCGRADGIAPFARRVGVPKSLISRWLSQPSPRLSLAIFLDIAASEGFSLAKMFQGDLSQARWGNTVEPTRQRRFKRRLDHYVLSTALENALSNGGTIRQVAADLAVDPSTLARHADLYGQLRDRNQERLKQEQARIHTEAVGQAEEVLLSLLRREQPPTLRNASGVTGNRWLPSQLRSIALQTIRARLGDRRIQLPNKSHSVGDTFRQLVAAAADRVRVAVVDGRQPHLT
jgi:hypothetical protein